MSHAQNGHHHRGPIGIRAYTGSRRSLIDLCRQCITEGSKGVTVDDLGRGLKSAAQNIEKEIPKMGSAIGHAVKKITEKGPEKPSSQEPAKQNK